MTEEQTQIEQLKEPLNCLMAGEWGFTEFKELPLIGEWATAIQSVPIALHVCLEHECAVNLKNALWKISPLSSDFINEEGIDVNILGGELMKLAEETAFTAIAGGIGLQVNEFASLLGSIALYLSLNSTIIATQIELFEKGNGVCLHKGPLPWPFPVKVGPLLVDIPVIVSPRTSVS
ncbi:hypothetical protein KQH65_00065 [archaeon]|nr:hypothetical protein [archaeon]